MRLIIDYVHSTGTKFEIDLKTRLFVETTIMYCLESGFPLVFSFVLSLRELRGCSNVVYVDQKKSSQSVRLVALSLSKRCTSR